MKYLQLKMFSTCLLLMLFVFSCSKNNPDGEELTEEEIAMQESIIESEEEPTPPDNSTQVEAVVDAPVEDLSNPKINYKGIKSKYNLSKYIFNLLNDNVVAITLLNKDTNFDPIEVDSNNQILEPIIDNEGEAPQDVSVPLANNQVISDRAIPLVMASVDNNKELSEYIKNIFPSYTTVATSKFISKTLVTLEDIRSFGAYIDTQLIVVRCFFEPSIGKYVYHIVYLQGDIANEQNPWYRTSTESEPINDSLAKLKIIDINSYSNVTTTLQEELDENGDPIETEDPSLDLISLQRKLLEFRAEILVGTWRDIHSGEIFEIRESLGNTINNKNKKYAAYSIMEADQVAVSINDSLTWINEDLKFEFNGLSGSAIFINDEKMVSEASVRAFPAKGLMIITLPNNRRKYLIPVLSDIDNSLYQELYSDIQREYKPVKENFYSSKYSMALESTPGLHVSSLSWVYYIGGFSLIVLLLL
jgi:hypothetical protein